MNFNWCNITTVFAYLAVIYILSSIIYLIITMKESTPLKDAINADPKLKEIKLKSKKKRSKIFWVSVLISILIMLIWKPFNKCILVREANSINDLMKLIN